VAESPLRTSEPGQPPVRLDGSSPDRLREIHRALLLPRLIEEKMLVLLRQGRLSKWFSGIGQEAIAVGVATALRPDDALLPLHRNLGVFTTRGLDLERLLRQLFGREGGYTGGRDRSFHFGDLETGIVGMISHLGAMLPVADGLALAYQLRGEERVAAAFIGDGGTSEGDFHEALNLAAVWKLPVLFLIENNQYGLSTPVSEQYACRNLADRGVGYGMPSDLVDGNDVMAVQRAVAKAAERARGGGGPTLLEFLTFRMRGHEEASGTAYVAPGLLREWSQRDPIVRFEEALARAALLDDDVRDRLRAELRSAIDSAAEAALAAPPPRSSPERELAEVYEPAPEPVPPAPGSAEREGRYVDAIADGLRTALERDPRVVLLGQDIAEYGGAFKVTAGLAGSFGRSRVRNTPIIESGAVGAALGLALEGFAPMVEMQFADFISCAFNQVVNNVAKTRYRWGAPVRLVIRAPVGGGVGAGPFHSQNVESWFTAVAGLKVVAPATPADAKGLLLAAFEDGNPVLFLEHKALYRSERGPIPDGFYTLPLGRARLARSGDDVTLLTYGVGVRWALEAAAALAEEDVSVEVLDLRTLLPWDVAAVTESVRKTGRALVLHEAPVTGGFGAELAATLQERAFEWLDAPVARLGALDTPVPFAKELEELHSPRGRLLGALRELLAY
jgi:2-oxoisovalerate dehydrogenase E1 component